MPHEVIHGLEGFRDRTTVAAKLIEFILLNIPLVDRLELEEVLKEEGFIIATLLDSGDIVRDATDHRNMRNALDLIQAWFSQKFATLSSSLGIPVIRPLPVSVLGEIDDLVNAPVNLEDFQLFVNGQEQQQGTDYTVSTPGPLDVNWVSSSFTLTPQDLVIVYYTK